MAKIKEEKEEVKKSKLDIALEKLEKDYGKGTTISGNTMRMDIEYISTGCIGLDFAIGIGGFPRGRIVDITAPESAGKAQPLSSKILTPYGWKTMGEMEIGTIVSTPDGTSSTIIGVFPQGIQDVYEVTFDDKSKVRCTWDHLWFINSRETELGEILTTGELVNRGLYSTHGTRKFKVPNIMPVHYHSTEKLPINPYLLGCLIGDGGLSDKMVKISNVDEEVLDRIREILHTEYDNMVLSHKHGLCTYNFKKKKSGHGKSELCEQLEKLGLMGKLSVDKFIPEIYQRASIENRIELLRGLMDTDGTAGNGASTGISTISYSTSSIKLSKDIVELCRGLGMRCNTSTRQTKYNTSLGTRVDGKESYQTHLLLGTYMFMPFKLTRQKDRFDANRKSGHRHKFIETIEYVGREECQCIAIGHPDQLYITDDFIVTHNTTLALHVIANAQKEGLKCAFIDMEHALSGKYAKSLGINMSDLIFSQPDYGEQALSIAEALVKTGEVAVVVIDSTASLIPKAEFESGVGTPTMAGVGRIMSQGLRVLTGPVYDNNVLLIFINQIRGNPGGMTAELPTGGNALKFYASVRLDMRRVKNDRDEELSRTKIKVLKNKVGTPFKEIEVDLVWGKGFGKTGEIVDIAEELGIVKRAGSWYSQGETKLGQGRNAIIELLENNPDMSADWESKIIDKLKGEE